MCITLLNTALVYLYGWVRFTLIHFHNGALHMGSETGFTGSRSPIRIQCCFAWAPHGRQTMCIALLDWICSTVTHHSIAARIRIEAVWRQSGLWIQIPDPHRIRIQGPVWRAPLCFCVVFENIFCIMMWITLFISNPENKLKNITWSQSLTWNPIDPTRII